MGETQSKPATIDAGPITVKPAVQTNTESRVIPGESPQVNGETPPKLQPGYRFKVPSVELCAMDSGLAPPVFAQLQQLFWAYDDSIYERQSTLSRHMQRVDSRLCQCQKTASRHDSKASLCVFDRTLPAMKENVNDIQDKLHSLEESVGKLSFLVAKLMSLQLEATVTSPSPPVSPARSPTDTDNVRTDKTPVPEDTGGNSAMEIPSLASSLVSIPQTTAPQTPTPAPAPVSALEGDSCADTFSSSPLSPHTSADVVEDYASVRVSHMEGSMWGKDNPTIEGVSISIGTGMCEASVGKGGEGQGEGEGEGEGVQERMEEAEEGGNVLVQKDQHADLVELVSDTSNRCGGDENAGQDSRGSSINT